MFARCARRPESSSGRSGSTRRRALPVFLLALLSALLLAATANAAADEGALSWQAQVPQSAISNALEGENVIVEAPDLGAARELPHQNLGREEAVELTESVFGSQLAATEGIFGELDVKKYLSTQAAIVETAAQPEALVRIGGGPESNSSDGGSETNLLESTLPLETEGPLGAPIPVDLSLQRGGEALEPAAPLVEVELPKELGEGIELPEPEIGIELVGGPTERAPSIVDENVASYPNVAEDTDFSVASTPTGVETLTTIRSAESPNAETLRLKLPSGASLQEAEAGAVVMKEGKELLSISSPTAVDASGAAVPVTMVIEGDSLVLTVSPSPDTKYPILVDPLFESFDWFDFKAFTGQNTWNFERNSGGFINNRYNFGLQINAEPLSYTPMQGGADIYYVPRYKSQEANGESLPSSFLVRMELMHVGFATGPGTSSPYELMGIMGPNHFVGEGTGGEALWAYEGDGRQFLVDPNNPTLYPGYTLNFENGSPGKRDVSGKVGVGLELAVNENANLAGQARSAFLGGAAVEVGDEGAPSLNSAGVSPWMNETATWPISAKAEDTGLGVKSISFETSPNISGAFTKTYVNPCAGTVENPCPRTWSAGVQPSEYSPKSLPQGYDDVTIKAKDLVGNQSVESSTGVLRIDHTAPVLTLSGSLTQQEGQTNLAAYTVKYTATDGTAKAPQSGVVKTEVRVDGTSVETYAPGCAEENCAISREWTLHTLGTSVGEHTLEVIATDGVGLKTTKVVHFVISRDNSSPTITSSGSLFEGSKGWLEDGTYAANLTATDPGGSGTTGLSLWIDGKPVQKASQNCELGGCKESLSVNVNTAAYEGGEHRVEVRAENAVGNKAVKEWTVYVDPAGSISASEATKTVEAVEATEPATEVVAPTAQILPAEEREEGNDPGLEVVDPGKYASTGVPVESSISTGAEPALAFEDAEGQQVNITPLGASASKGPATVVEGAAAVVPATKGGTDSVVRPQYNGLLDFQDIREPNSPEEESWEIEVLPGERLEAQEGGQTAELLFHETDMMLISAMPAHDAVGHTVPTHLSVIAPNIVTLTVEHRKGSYVYPIIAGPSFEVGYSNVTVTVPPVYEEEEEVQRAAKGIPVREVIGAPEPDAAPEKNEEVVYLIANLPPSHVHVRFEMCSQAVIPVINVGGCEAWERTMKLSFHENRNSAWWNPAQVHPNCLEAHQVSNVTQNVEYCDWVGPNHQPYGSGYHISAQVEDTVTVTAPLPVPFSQTDNNIATAYLYGDGYTSPLHMTAALCNPLSSCP